MFDLFVYPLVFLSISSCPILAQDRAHRIGQKKVVRVYRLVTESTIEEKVVMRAQQKLKLDAMVVQQGRLQSKDKLSKNDLMDALRFGAEKVFRANDDGGVTDEDIDMILDRGKKKTEEMMSKLNSKLEDAEKGDMLDFKLDGGMKAQTFEGQDYSAAGRQQGPIIDKMVSINCVYLFCSLLLILDFTNLFT
jgi:SWI/SNF-related matrix-associated actin-dependent regulator of chromatin subfamily A member 5